MKRVKKAGKAAGSILLTAALAAASMQGLSMMGQRTADAAEIKDAENNLILWYDEPAEAGLYEIFASRKWPFAWSSGVLNKGELLGDDNLEFGRNDPYNYTDNKSHSSSKDTTKPIQFGGTWDVTDAVKQGVTWAKHALPVGNGRMGAMSFGYLDTEIVQMNEESLWTGGPGSEENLAADNNADVYGNKNIADPQANMKSLVDNAFKEYYSCLETGAITEDSKTLASPYSNVNKQTGITPNKREQEGAYQSFAEMKIDFGQSFDKTQNYKRALNLNTAISSVVYDYEGVTYERELFASYPDDVMVYKISASEGGKVNFTLHPEIPQMGIFEGRYIDTSQNYGKENYGKEGTVVADGDTITLSGTLNHNGMKFMGKYKVVASGGTMAADNEENYALKNSKDNGSITVSGADEAYIVVSLTTDYVNDFDKDYTTGETLEQLGDKMEDKVETAAARGYDNLYARHEQDYRELFDRVRIDIGAEFPETITTDVLLADYKDNYKTDQDDAAYNRYLETLYYQYGRYMLIASSREGSLPANLQGVWNDTDGPAWNSDYHTNINLQMNYWLAESTNLSETVTPLVDYANSLRKPGRLTLAKSYGIGYQSDESKIDLDTEDGFAFYCSTTARGFTGNIDSNAAFAPTATAFLGQNLFDYYAYTKDLEYLRSDIYPYLKEAARTYLQTMHPGRTEDDAQNLFVVPSYSSEQGPWTVGTYFDQQLVWQLFHDTLEAMDDLEITASETMADEGAVTYLNDDSKLRARLEDAIQRLDPVAVGAENQIKEWRQEVKYNRTSSGKGLGSDNHRHISQLMALYPGNYIRKDNSELIEASKFVLTKRTDVSTGWGLAYRLNLWARTGDGEHAYDIINALLATSTYDNLFDTHAPFQIDGNFGATAGITEMLMQSHEDKIELLPAVPAAWSDGYYEGLVARGNFEVDLQWKDGAAKYASITSNAGGTLQLTGIDAAKITDEQGNEVAFTKNADGSYSLETEKGKTYMFHTDGYVPDENPTPEPIPSDAGGVVVSSRPRPTSVVPQPTGTTDAPEPTETLASSEPSASSEPEPAVSGEPQPSGSTDYRLGDINNDQTVDLEDAQLALKAALKIITLNDPQKKAADVNKDQVINLEDAQLILKAALKIISL